MIIGVIMQTLPYIWVIQNWNEFYNTVEWNWFNTTLVLQYMFIFHYGVFSILTGYTGLRPVVWTLSYFNIFIFLLLIGVATVQFFNAGAVSGDMWGAIFDMSGVCVTCWGWMRAVGTQVSEIPKTLYLVNGRYYMRV